MKGETRIHEKPVKNTAYSFVLSFGRTRADFKTEGRGVVKILDGDAVRWLAYPKGTSKKLTSEVNRDILWEILMLLAYGRCGRSQSTRIGAQFDFERTNM